MSNIQAGAAGGGGGSSLTVGTTTVSGGTSGFALTDNAGVLGNTQIRTILTGNLNLYVNAATGSDSYNGLSATFTGGVNGPWATIQHSIDVPSATYDLAGFTIIDNVAAGSYAGFGAKPMSGGGNFFIKLDPSAVATGGPNDGIFNNGEIASWYADSTGTTWWMGGGTLDGSAGLVGSAGANVFVSNYNSLLFQDPTDLATPVNIASIATGAQGHFQSDTIGQFEDGGADITVSGDALFVIAPFAGSQQLITGNYTLNGAQAYGNGFLWGSGLGYSVIFPTIVAGSATGPSFTLEAGAGVNGLPPSALPGSAAGSCDPSSFYNGSNDPNFSVQTPTTGTTINMVSQHGLVLNPGGPLTTLTINLPPLPTTFPLTTVDSWNVNISTTQAIAALTIGETDGSTIVGAPTSLAANSGFSMVYDLNSNTWYPQEVAGGVATSVTTFNPTSVGAAGGLSLDDLRFSANVSGWASARTVTGHASGKWYGEFICSADSFNNAMFGLSDGSVSPMSGYLSSIGDNSIGLQGNGTNYTTGFTGATSSNYDTADQIIGIAVDVTNKMAWFSINGLWIASGNPVTAANPWATWSGSYTIYLACSILNFASSSFKPLYYTPPIGFSPWG